MATLQQLVNRIQACANGRISSRHFEDWFVSFLWDAEESGDSKLIALSNRIEGLLAEASHAHWSESGIRFELANAIHPFESAQRKPPQPERPEIYLPNTSLRTRSAADSIKVLAQVS